MGRRKRTRGTEARRNARVGANSAVAKRLQADLRSRALPSLEHVFKSFAAKGRPGTPHPVLLGEHLPQCSSATATASSPKTTIARACSSERSRFQRNPGQRSPCRFGVRTSLQTPDPDTVAAHKLMPTSVGHSPTKQERPCVYELPSLAANSSRTLNNSVSGVPCQGLTAIHCPLWSGRTQWTSSSTKTISLGRAFATNARSL